jgi:hypothetical protein
MPKPTPNYIKARNYKNYDPIEFALDVAQIPWYVNSLIDNVNQKFDHFNSNFNSVLDKHAPVKTMKNRY